jgi:outer membrane protein assembly factor BamB
MGHTVETELPLTWGGPANENVLWKSPLIGQGHASPIVWKDRVFVCTAQWPDSVADRTEREKIIPAHHVLCYDARSGRLLWNTSIPPGPWRRTDFRSGAGGGYASPTPATDGKRVYCLFGSSVLAAVDFQGRIVWRKEIVPHTFDVTIGTSPILFRDSLILACEMANQQDSKVIAFDPSTGAVRWEEKLPTMGFGHSTPVIIEVRGRPQMLLPAGGLGKLSVALRSLDPTTGKLLWWCAGSGESASAVYGAGIVYFDNGRGGPGVAVDPTGSGDVTRTHIKWQVNVPGGIGSPLIVGDHVYRLHDPGVLKCWRASDGAQVYAKRLDGLETTWASPIVDARGRIFFANAGKSFVIRSGPEFEVLAANDLQDLNHPSPAVASGRMYLVGSKNVYCIGKR